MRRRIMASICVAAALLVSSVSTGAHDHDSVAMWSVTIQSSGTLAASFRVAPSPPRQGTDPVADGAERDGRLLLDLIDLRGVPTGWTVLISAGDTQGLSLEPEVIQTWLGNPELASMETFALEPVTTVPARGWFAGVGHGDGLYTLEFDSTLRIGPALPGASPVTLILDLQGNSP